MPAVNALCVCGHVSHDHVKNRGDGTGACLVCTCPKFDLAGSNDPAKPPEYVYDPTCKCVACAVRREGKR